MPNPTIVFIAVSLIGIITIIGWYLGRFIKGQSENWIVAGKQLTLPLAATTLMAQSIDSNATLGNVDLTHQFGFWSGAALPIGLALCLLLTGLFFAKPLHKMNLLTLGDFYKVKYGRLVEVIASIIMFTSFAILLGGNFVALGKILEFFFSIPFYWGVILSGIAIGIYITPAGLLADAYTDIIKAIVFIIGTAIAIFFVASNFGLPIFAETGPLDLGQLIYLEKGGLINWATILALGLGDIVAIDFMARVFASKTTDIAKKACYLGALGTILIGIPYSLFGLATASMNVPGPEQAPALFNLLHTFPPVLAGIVLAGMISASLSTADGAVVGTSSVAARNILGIRPSENNKSKTDYLLWAARLCIIPILLLSIAMAILVPHTAILLVLAFDVTFATIFIPLVLGLFWKKSNAKAALAAIIAGLVIRLGAFVLTPTIYGIPNTLLYIPNETFLSLTDPATGVAIRDGLSTLLAPVVSFIAFIVVSTLSSSAKQA